jgi:hypothetical protein
VKKHFFLLMVPSLLVVCAVAVAGQVEPALGLRIDKQPARTDPYGSLSEKEESDFRSSALAGSGADAYHLAMYYGMTKVDLEASLRWAIIGAENGDARSQWLAFSLLENRAEADERARARFWLKRAADQGYQPAQKELTGERTSDHAAADKRSGK